MRWTWFENAFSKLWKLQRTSAPHRRPFRPTLELLEGRLTPSALVDLDDGSNLVDEGAAYGSLVGVTAHWDDPEAVDPIYSIVSDTSGGAFQIDSSSGVITVADGSLIDFASSLGGYTVEVHATAGELESDTTPFAIAVSEPAEATTLTVTADHLSKTYGASDPALTYHVSGLLPGHTEEDVLSGSLDRVAGEAVGSYDIGVGTLTANGNYTLSFVADTLDITAATLTVTADHQSKVYGSSDPPLTFQVSGLQGDDTAEGVLSGALERDAGEAVGSYDITVGTLAANSNYTLSYVGDTLEITAATLTVTADHQSKVYGSSDPALTYQVSGLQGDDTAEGVLSGALDRDAGEAVGSYDIGVGTLTANGNYSLSFVADTLEITAATLTVTADHKSKVYGSSDPALTFQVSGLQGDDGEADVLSGALDRVAGEAVGSYDIGVGTLTANGNYSLTFVGDTLEITAATLTVTADHQSKVYGSSDPALTYQVSGLQGDDSEADVLSGALDRDAGEAVGSYNITQGTLAVTGNYSLNFMGDTLDIVAPGISGRVWNDSANNDGIRDSSEPALAGISIYLKDSAHDDVDATVTSADGTYSFAGLAAGDYYVVFLLPADYSFSPQHAGADPTRDSDASPIALGLGESQMISLAIGEAKNAVDAGMNTDGEDEGSGPEITAIADRSDIEGRTVSIQITANDPDGDAITHYEAVDIPPGVIINPNTGLLSGNLTYESAGVYDTTITVTDATGAASMIGFTWTVQDASLVLVGREIYAGTAPGTPLSNNVTVDGLTGQELWISHRANDVRLTALAPAGGSLPLLSDILFRLDGGSSATPGSGNFATTPIISFPVDGTTLMYTVNVGIDMDGSGTFEVATELTERFFVRIIDLGSGASVGSQRIGGGPLEASMFSIKYGEHFEVGGQFSFGILGGLQGANSMLRWELWDADIFTQSGLRASGPGNSFTHTFTTGGFEGYCGVRFFADMNGNGQYETFEQEISASTFWVQQTKQYDIRYDISTSFAALDPAFVAALPTYFSAAQDLLVRKDSADDWRAAVEFNPIFLGYFAPSPTRPDPAPKNSLDGHFSANADIAFVTDILGAGGVTILGDVHSIVIEHMTYSLLGAAGPAWIANAIAHEMGHGVGLEHPLGAADASPRLMWSGLLTGSDNVLTESEANTFD